MKDNQVKKLTRVVRKLADEVAALRKLIRRELLTKGRAGKPRKAEKKGKKKKARAQTDPAPPAA